MKPVIGIGANALLEPVPQLFNNLVAYTPQDIVNGVQLAGGAPLLLPIGNADLAQQYVNLIDGLLLAGGQDVSPLLYGEDPLPQLESTLPTRDAFEMHLIVETLRQKKPIFAICRGMQLLNVACGGTLYQDIHTQADQSIKHLQSTLPQFVSHSIKTEPNSIIENILGAQSLVNTLHHQAIKDIGDSLKATAYSPDGFIEAMEWENTQQYVLAVQWHPEILLQNQHEESLALFKHFIQATKQ